MTQDKWKIRLDLLDRGIVVQTRAVYDEYEEFQLKWNVWTFSAIIRKDDNAKDKLDEVWEKVFFFFATLYIKEQFPKPKDGTYTKKLAQ